MGVFILSYERRVMGAFPVIGKNGYDRTRRHRRNEMVGSFALDDSLRLQKLVMLLPATFLSGARILHCQGAEVEQLTLGQRNGPG